MIQTKGVRRGLALLLLTVAAGCQRTSPVGFSQPVADAPIKPETPRSLPYDEIGLGSQSRAIPVIMYHDATADDKKTVWYDVTASEFRAQCDAIERAGLQPISLDDFYGHMTTGREVPEGSIVLTFDDNYQGFYDHAYPELKKRRWPSAMFVHTGFVGQKTGKHPKMSYDTLRELVKDGLVSIGSHTITHPADLSKLSRGVQRDELTKSKADLERELGVKVVDFAYPNGGNDPACQALAREVGYRMAFTIKNGIAESSPNLMAVNRYVHTKFEKALDDRERAIDGGAGRVADETLDRAAPVNYREGKFAGLELALAEGGDPVTLQSETREGVSEFIARTPGAVAGINGTFFAMAALRATDNRLVGPAKTTEAPEVLPDKETFRYEKLVNRPLVVLSKDRFALVPYNPWAFASDAPFRAFRPDMTDVFMGGVWLVHLGVPASEKALKTFGAGDLADMRRRAFFGLDGAGRIVLGASKESCSSETLAAAAAEAGVREAVLLDSGFSTSLVYDGKILASGHSTTTLPSRPVPHAILLKGTLDPAGQAVATAAKPATTVTGGDPGPRRKKRRNRR